MSSCCDCLTLLFCSSSYTSSMEFSERYNQEVSEHKQFSGTKVTKGNERKHARGRIDHMAVRRDGNFAEGLASLLVRVCVCLRVGFQSPPTVTYCSKKESDHFKSLKLTHSHGQTHSKSERIERLAWRQHAVHGYNMNKYIYTDSLSATIISICFIFI